MLGSCTARNSRGGVRDGRVPDVRWEADPGCWEAYVWRFP